MITTKFEEGKKKVSRSSSLVGTLAIIFLLVASPAGLALTYNRIAGATSIVGGAASGITVIPPTSMNTTGMAPGLANVTSLPRGCYALSPGANSWTSVTCDTSQQASKLPKPTEGGSHGVKGESSESLIIQGVIDYYPSVPSSPGISDSSKGSGSFSVQANTNGFTGNNGQLDWVQFTDQNNAGSPSNNFCIWNVDITTQNYDNNCMSLPYYMVGLYGIPWLYMYGGAPGNGNLYAEFCMESTKYCYSISAPDEYCLGGCSAEFDKFFSLTGTILGYGGGSEASFVKGSTLTTNVALYKPTKPFASGEQNVITDEENNLPTQSTSSGGCSGGYCWVDTSA
jgi:hypothetical protein